MQSEQDYQAALKQLEMIFDAQPGTAEGDELEILAALIDQYERNNFPLDS
ncbi:MAG: transcriptional regulator [Bacteroidetes bacterium]|nr:transcriptional regulator [Bacteroidota bacterium]